LSGQIWRTWFNRNPLGSICFAGRVEGAPEEGFVHGVHKMLGQHSQILALAAKFRYPDI
jgi:hypothetical protein